VPIDSTPPHGNEQMAGFYSAAIDGYAGYFDIRHISLVKRRWDFSKYFSKG
jgi:hypothetical protein